jgi:hypothetical protein
MTATYRFDPARLAEPFPGRGERPAPTIPAGLIRHQPRFGVGCRPLERAVRHVVAQPAARLSLSPIPGRRPL